jgi:tetratricopeptide (TPR) repeat protein
MRVLLGRPTRGTYHGDEFVERLSMALREDGRFAALVQTVLAGLPAMYRVGMERIGTGPVAGVDGFEYFVMQKEIIRTLLQHMAQQVALVLICDDVSEDFLRVLDSYTQGLELGICVTSTHAHDWGNSEIVVVPRLARYDVELMIQTMLNGDDYDAELVDVVTEACHTPEDVRYLLMQFIQRQGVSWDGVQRRWRLAPAVHTGETLRSLPVYPVTVLPVLQLFVVMREVLSRDMFARIQWLVEVDGAAALAWLIQHGILLADDQGYQLSPAWSPQYVREAMTALQREQAHRHALQCSEGLLYVEHAVALGEVTMAYTALVNVTELAWRYGNVLRLRRALHLLQQLCEQSDAADIRWLHALTLVRLTRFGAPVTEVEHAIAFLKSHSYRSPQHAVECMLHVALVLRWGGFPRETIAILENLYLQVGTLQLPKIEFQIVNALIYASLDYGAVTTGMVWLERLRAPDADALEMVVIGLTRSYVLARLGHIATARATVTHIRNLVGDANVRTVALLSYHAGLVECAAIAYEPCLEYLRIAWQRTFEVGEVLTHLMAGALLCMVHARHGQFVAMTGMVTMVIEQATALHLARQRLLATSAYVRMLVAQAHYEQALEMLDTAYQVATYHELREYTVGVAGLAMMTHRHRGTTDAQWRQRLEQSQLHGEANHVGLWQHELAWACYQSGQIAEAIVQALSAIENAEHFRLQPISPLEVMMQAWAVLQRCRYAHIAPLTARIGRALVAALQELPDPFQRQRFLAVLPDVDVLCEVAYPDEQVVIWRLPHITAPRGKPLQAGDFVPVILVLKHTQQAATLGAQIEFVVSQAAQQHACVTVKQLAEMLHVHERTVLRALKQARESGKYIDTFRPRVPASARLTP